MRKEIHTALPAMMPAWPSKAKMPAPIIVPTPSETAEENDIVAPPVVMVTCIQRPLGDRWACDSAGEPAAT